MAYVNNNFLVYNTTYIQLAIVFQVVYYYII